MPDVQDFGRFAMHMDLFFQVRDVHYEAQYAVTRSEPGLIEIFHSPHDAALDLFDRPGRYMLLAGSDVALDASGMVSGTVESVTFRNADATGEVTASGLVLPGRIFSDAYTARAQDDFAGVEAFFATIAQALPLPGSALGDDSVTLQTRGLGFGYETLALGQGNDTVMPGGSPPDGFPDLRGGAGVDWIVGGDLLIDTGEGSLSHLGAEARLDGFERFELSLQSRFKGSAEDEYVDARMAFSARIDGKGGDDTLLGGIYLDTITGGLGNDIIDASSGADTVVGGQGQDTIWGREGDDVLFGDAIVVPSSNYGLVYRTFNVLLGREPDAETYRAMGAALETGQPIPVGIVNAILNSAEYRAQYGSETNAETLARIYDSLPGDQSMLIGRNLQNLEAGRTSMSEILYFAIESASNARALKEQAVQYHHDVVQGGQWYADVFWLYQGAFDRAPDTDGFFAWVEQLALGKDLDAVTSSFLTSREFQILHGSTTPETFVTLLYDTMLNRVPDDGGFAWWVNAIESGKSRADVLYAFADSAEFQTQPREAVLQDWLGGLEQADVIDAGSGDNFVFGGLGEDVFVFERGWPPQSTVIGDFDGTDILRFSGFGFANRAEALAAFEVSGADLVFDVQNLEIVIREPVTALTIDNIEIA